MSYATVRSVGLVGLAGQLVEVEADLAAGLPGLSLVGLPDTALFEARDRIRAAIVNSGESWPNRRITINLLPASTRKHGSAFDLAMAVGVLGAAGVLPLAPLHDVVLLGELSLDGSVRPLTGVLPCVLAASRAGITKVVVPLANAREAALVPGVAVRATDSLRRLIGFVRGTTALLDPPPATPSPPDPMLDLADVVGQELGRRGLELAAAGGHHLCLIGPPGAGKTMLAQRLPSILPPLSDEDAMEVTGVHSIAGALPPTAPLIRQPPFQAPHHSASVAALVGGGARLARPGVISLAHKGVMFMDEAPEFAAAALESLRQPLEHGYVVLSRAHGHTRYPCRFQLVLAANPCPCASPAGDVRCQCSPLVRRRYLGRLSGPLMDRVDIQITLPPVTAAHLAHDTNAAEPSATVADRVRRARDAAAARWAASGWQTNAQVPGPILRRPPWRLPVTATRALERALDNGEISARGYDRVLRVAWTISDLDGRARPGEADVAEALGMRIGRFR